MSNLWASKLNIKFYRPSTTLSWEYVTTFLFRNLTLTFYISVEVQAISNKIFDLPLKLCSEDVF